ncbi:MAG: AEC family transporter [Anaerolineae bacterium]
MTSFLSIVYNVLTPIFLVIGLAVLLDRRFALDPRVFSRAVVYLFSPCLVFGGIARSDLRAEELGLILAMAALTSLLMALVGWAEARLFGFDRKLAGAFMLSVVLVNAGNYGLPLNNFAYGQAGMQRAIVFFVVTALVSNTLGVYLASRGTASVRRSLLNVVTVPLPYATLLGFLFNVKGIMLPVPVDRAVTLLGGAAVPGMLLILGLQLSRTSIKGRIGAVILATVTRLGVAPLVALLLASLLGLSGLARQVSIVEASMPTAVMAGVLATEFGSDAEFTTTVVLVSTLASVVTLSILLMLLT